MIHLKDNFKSNAPISQVPASWFNQVASFLNNLIGGYGIKMTKNATGASVISVDPGILGENEGNVGTPKNFYKSVEYDSIPLEDSQKDLKWTRGNISNATKTPVGVKFQVVSRIVSLGGIAYQFYLRDMEVDSTGRIKSISKEIGYFEVTAGY